METKADRSFTGRYSLIFGLVLTLMGVVETFVRPKPDSYFGIALLVFGPAMLLLSRSGRSNSTGLRTVATVLAGVGVAIALFDMANDILS